MFKSKHVAYQLKTTVKTVTTVKTLNNTNSLMGNNFAYFLLLDKIASNKSCSEENLSVSDV